MLQILGLPGLFHSICWWIQKQGRSTGRWNDIVEQGSPETSWSILISQKPSFLLFPYGFDILLFAVHVQLVGYISFQQYVSIGQGLKEDQLKRKHLEASSMSDAALSAMIISGKFGNQQADSWSEQSCSALIWDSRAPSHCLRLKQMLQNATRLGNMTIKPVWPLKHPARSRQGPHLTPSFPQPTSSSKRVGEPDYACRNSTPNN